ncbi:type III toxin-antitoxin system CptIN family toxin, partial [Heyndrickxia sporothermodurans]
MEINKHFIYKIKDNYYQDFPDPNLKNNKGESRPNYFVFQGKEEDILWFIPMSSKVEKFERILKDREEQGKPTDIAYVCEVGSRKQAFVIQDMFPVTREYVKEEYIVNKNPYRLVDNKDIKNIEEKALRIKNLIDKNIKFNRMQPNVKEIEKQLIKKSIINTKNI